MKKLLFLALVSGFLFCLIAGLEANAQEKTIVLKYSNFFPAPHANSVLADQWCKEVEKRTNGRVKINYYPGAVLTPATQTYDSVVKGIADIGLSVQAYTRGKFPLTEVVDLPLGYKTGLGATKMINAFYDKFKPKEYDETHVLYLHSPGPGILHTRKPVSRLEEVKGLKIRSTGLSAKLAQALGGTPVGMPMTESYDALAKGVVDGILTTDEALEGFKLGEVLSFTTENYTTASAVAFFVVMNKTRWNALPKDIQATIDKINEEWIEKTGKNWDEIDAKGRVFAQQHGMKRIQLSAAEGARWAAAARPLLDDYVKASKAKNLPGDETLKFCLDYRKTQD